MRFTDISTGISVAWNGSFGDGNFSALQNPIHTYSRGGAYTVSLKVTTTQGTDTLTRPDYIIVNGARIGVFRNASGTWYLDYDNHGIADTSFPFGKYGDRSVTGDGDGSADAGVFRPVKRLRAKKFLLIYSCRYCTAYNA